MKDLLICIAFHYEVPERLVYLLEVLDNINEYECSYDIIIDTNLEQEHEIVIELKKQAEVFSHKNLYQNLVMCHRKHMKRLIDNYKNFMYIEDDMKVPYKTYLNYIKNFNILFPSNVPACVRLETDGKDYYVVDCSHSQVAEPLITKGNKVFFKSGNPYHAFWAMPQDLLKSTMVSDFDREDIFKYREIAASYPSMEILKDLYKCLIEVVNKEGKWYVHEDCYCYHVSNSYRKKGSHEGTLPIQNYLA